jgi:O-methyltransferase
MRALLGVYNQPDRNVWLADSFQGLPPADEASYPKDQGDRHVELTPYLGVSMETVQDNFRQFELLDGQVKFLKGWFRDTLPTAPMERIAVLRLDGDMYESTMVGLTALYPKVSAGGFVIVDDYGALPNCRAAVEDYRAQHGVSGEIELVDWTGAFWRKDA